jgi:hypothetical protein
MLSSHLVDKKYWDRQRALLRESLIQVHAHASQVLLYLWYNNTYLKGLLSYRQIQTAKYTQYDQHINPWKNGDVEVRRQHSKVLSTKLVFIVNLWCHLATVRATWCWVIVELANDCCFFSKNANDSSVSFSSTTWNSSN